ncbi:MAG: hypothetical protein ACRD2G_09275, partial [Terriglobia bacterium]
PEGERVASGASRVRGFDVAELKLHPEANDASERKQNGNQANGRTARSGKQVAAKQKRIVLLFCKLLKLKEH